jgi:large subunit ribosomal protein L23
MELTIYDIIQGPLVTEKAVSLNKKLKKLVLKVHPQANKPLVKEALEKLFGVKVEDVNIMVRKGKKRMVGRRPVHSSTIKKAVVTLKEGHSLDLLDQAGSEVVTQEVKN